MSIISLFAATQIKCVACGCCRVRPVGFVGPTSKVRCDSRVCRGAVTVHGVVKPKESLPTASAQERAHGPAVLLTSVDRARAERYEAADAARARSMAALKERNRARRARGLCARCEEPSETYHCRVCRPLGAPKVVFGSVSMERILATTAKVFGLSVAQLRLRQRPGVGDRGEKRAQWAAIYIGCNKGWRPKEVAACFSHADGTPVPAWWVADQRISAERWMKSDAEFFARLVLAENHSTDAAVGHGQKAA